MSGAALSAFLLLFLPISPQDAPAPTVDQALHELDAAHDALTKIDPINYKQRNEIRKRLSPAFRVLEKSDDPRAVPAIGRYLVYNDFETTAARALSAIGTREAMKFLEQALLRDRGCLRDNRFCRRLALLRNVGKGELAFEAIGELIAKEPHAGTVRLALGNIGDRFSKEAVDKTLEGLDRSILGTSGSRVADLETIGVFRSFLSKGLDSKRKKALEKEARNEILDALLQRAKNEETREIGRAVALRLLGSRKDSRILDTIQSLLETLDAPHILTLSACRAAVDLGDPKAGPWLLPVLERWLQPTRGSGEETQLPLEDIALLVSHAAPLEIPAQDIVRKLLRSKIPELAHAALLALPILTEKEIERGIKKSIQAKDWRTRSIAVECCGRLRNAYAVTTLIGRMKKERGRLRQDILRVLHQLTGVYMEYVPADWEKWWQHAQKDWSPVDPDKIDDSPTVVAWPGASYFGMQIVSRRICFIADISGSMGGRLRYEGETLPKIEVLKKQLLSLLKSLEKKTYVNVYFFNSGFEKLFPQLAAMSSGRKRSLERFVREVKASGGTNIYDPLEDALKDPHVDTIYLLSDGAPGSGKYVEPWDILQAVQSINRLRKIQINVISIGADAAWMEELARENHGSYVFFK